MSKPPLPQGAVLAAIVSAAMIAHQVAGKAARDALFLSSFHVTALPAMMAGSALLSLLVAPALSKLIVRYSPRKIVTASFAVSAVALLLEWALSFSQPRLVAIAIYLHMAVFGASSISAFWSFMNEKYDPHAGKRAVAWVAGGGSVGGIVGGVLAWRAAPLIAVSTMLPLLAALNGVCLWGSIRLGSAEKPPADAPDAHSGSPEEASRYQSAFKVLRETRYLQNVVVVVALGAITSGLLEYVFSAQAVRQYSGSQLLSFFALFWLSVGIASLAMQVLLSAVALEKLGLAVTVAMLPGIVVLGGAFGLAVPGLWSASLLRGGEAANRNSLFRAAYELLYTPLSEQKRRSTKMLIDVGVDRLGTVAASLIVVAALGFAHDASAAQVVILAVAVALALVTLTRSGPLHTGYLQVMKESLKREDARVASAEEPVATRTVGEAITLRDDIVARQQDLLATADDPTTRALAMQVALQEALRDARRLCSTSAIEVRGVLGAEAPLTAPLVWFAIALLESKEFHLDAQRSLRRVAGTVTGQLSDALCDRRVPFDVRRRIPRVLGECRTQLAADALIRGTRDERFEVRFECGRALLKMTAAMADIEVTLPTVVAMVEREVAVSRDIWEAQRQTELDDDDDDEPILVDRLLRDRVDRSLEHVFTILALVIDRESLRLAFRALHQEDERLRGTALEYLETVLPDEILAALLPFLGETRALPRARPATEILADLVAACALPPGDAAGQVNAPSPS